MLYRKKQLPELYYMKHRHDNDNDYVDYENMLLDKTLTPYLYQNETMNGFLKNKVKKQFVLATKPGLFIGL